MSKTMDIRDHCLDCGGGSPKEVTLCLVIGCTLWLHRFGCSYKSQQFKARVESAKQRYPHECLEMVETLREYRNTHPNSPGYAETLAILEGKSGQE